MIARADFNAHNHNLNHPDQNQLGKSAQTMMMGAAQSTDGEGPKLFNFCIQHRSFPMSAANINAKQILAHLFIREQM